jgi:3-deoxy-D-arabino-heptulosonate 7-phosphate (DAHP) synthase
MVTPQVDPSANGGAERYAWLLARALAASGWSMVIGVHNGLQPGVRVTIDDVSFVGSGRTQTFMSWYRFLKGAVAIVAAICSWGFP